jgi:hypothetical protein
VALDVCLSYDAGCHRLGDVGERLVELLYELTERRCAPRRVLCMPHSACGMALRAPSARGRICARRPCRASIETTGVAWLPAEAWR